jgi:ABC-type lipoprotein release transport system permease subunit
MVTNLFKMGWRNTWRNKRRTNFTLCAIAFGVMSIVFVRSYFGGILKSASEGLIKNQLGHVKIAHKEFLRLERIIPREHLVTDSSRLQDMISTLPGIELFVERLKFNALLSSGEANESTVVIGIDPEKADKGMDISNSMIRGSYLGESGQDVIIGSLLARELNVPLNDELLLVTTDINYSTYALPFRLTGIFETGYPSIDKNIIYMSLVNAREMLDCENQTHEVLLYLNNPDAAVKTSENIKLLLDQQAPNHQLRVIPWQKNDFIKTFIPYSQRFLDIIMYIFMLIAALVILNTMLMSVMDRYHEIGVIKALGFKNREVIQMILVESFFIGIIGSLAGGIMGGSISMVLEKTGIDLAQMAGEKVWEKIEIPIPMLTRVIHPDFTFSILIGSIFFGILVTVAAALYPAYKSSRMSPVEALRSQLQV